MRRLPDRAAVVTGAGSGVGWAAARRPAGEGTKVEAAGMGAAGAR